MDRELQPHAVKRVLEVDGTTVVAFVVDIVGRKARANVKTCRTISTLTIRLARLSLNAFLENVDLVVRTLHEFSSDQATS